MMNVFVIAGRGWNKDSIIESLSGEGYPHNFFFGQNQDHDELVRKITSADEVWIFGDCVEYDMYKYAIKNQLNIWRMG